VALPLTLATTPQASALALIEPDLLSWDAFVSEHLYGHLLQRSAWGALKSDFGWQSRRVAVAGTSFDQASVPKLRAGAQLLIRRRYGFALIYVPRGPLFSGDDAIDALLLRGIVRIARRSRAIFVRFEPNLLEQDDGADQLHTGLLLQGFRSVEPIQPQSTIRLSLNASPETLFAAFSKGHRADIRRAERQGVRVRVGEQVDVAAFYAIMEATSARAGFNIHAPEYYQSAWNRFQPDSLLLLAERAGETLAAHMVFSDGRTGLYFYGGATDEGLKSGANHALQWAAIRWAQERGCHSYDFWGIPDALGRAAHAPGEAEQAALEATAQQDALIGVYRFKKGFGGDIVRFLPAYDYVYINPLYQLVRRRLG
jgi:lipid II:glycine glycyltransferase (peptidoglycan interpeptide bridge formation enzyme)